MLLLSNMFPSEGNYFGIFVYKSLKGLQLSFDVDHLYVKNSRYKVLRIINYIKFYLSTVFLKNNYDYVYIHYPTRTAIPLLLNKSLFNSKIILNFHGSDLISNSFINKILNQLLLRIYVKANLIVTPTTYYSSVVSKLFQNDNVVVSPSSGVPAFFYEVEYKPQKPYIFTYISTVNEEKGVFDLCKAFTTYALSYPNSYLHIYGNVDKTNSLNLKNYLSQNINIVYMGTVNNIQIPSILAKSYCFVFPSKKESLGLVGLEALAIGCVVISSDIPALQTYLKNGYNCLMYERSNIASLVEKMLTISNNPELHEYLQRNARPSVSSYRQDFVHKNLNDTIQYI